jgi:hypothetical protein
MSRGNFDWSRTVALISVVGFTIVVLIRIFLTFYYLKRRPRNPSFETERVHPYLIRDATVFLTAREVWSIGPLLGYIAVTFWGLGLVTAFLTRH